MFRWISLVLLIIFSNNNSFLPIYKQDTGNTVFGYTKGEFTITETSSAIYNIPVTVSPGIGGMLPQLAITYLTSSNNFILGEGFSLSGLSIISRCPVTEEQDGFFDGVDFDDLDRFCFDGERIMVINNGLYGADKAEYRTEQNAFVKIISYGETGYGPKKFKVWTKSGLIKEYGFTNDSRIELSGTTDKVIVWALNKISDTKGNYIAFLYTCSGTCDTGCYTSLSVWKYMVTTFLQIITS